MESIINFFKTINYKKALVLILGPLLLMWQSMEKMFVSLIVLITIDMIMGIRVYLKDNKVNLTVLRPSTWKHIQSSGLKRTSSKAKDYFLVIAATYAINAHVLKKPIIIYNYSAQEIVLITLAIIELWSIGENFRKLRGYNIFDYVIGFIKDKDWKKTLDDIKKHKPTE